MNNQQNEIPNLSVLKSLEVLILANFKMTENITFVKVTPMKLLEAKQFWLRRTIHGREIG
ncbi:hypothetical protein DCO56_11455 [Sphingobacterium athyrii]|uniref:Uncharacterized protein n=1 Tax=Sphingobacterium athyrii TaxID=2152717 RepID=A0A363NT54_9SPHI|nr:hypothetical protein DCO56_11455 [Sphingobacterium athyrii]